MSATLDPIVVNKLRQFSRRRRRLLLARGLSAGIVALLLGLAIVGFADWLWLLSDQARWLLSGGVYLAVAIVVWVTSVRQLAQAPRRHELASRVEELQPELRERLLSAVELAVEDERVLHDSPVFRQLLQHDVAQQMLPIKIGKLLPIKLIAFWLVAAVVIGTLAIALLSGPDQRFRQLATRALLPGANIARISRVQVEIVEPHPPSQTVAQNESMAVVIRTSGGRVSEATLELTTASKGTVRQNMTSVGDSEFAANIHVADEDVDYRILAGDAVTQHYRIAAAARPHVKSFEKQYRFPEYAQLPDVVVAEPHGDVVILKGTTAHLVLDVDQPVSEAELLIESSETNDVRVLKLAQSSESELKWEAEFPVEEAAIYRVHLRSVESGFDNPFSPKYEIRPLPDLVPRVGFIDQSNSSLLLPPNDLLALEGMAEDDLPLAQLQQHVSVNGQEWEVTELEFVARDRDPDHQIRAAWQWDLEPLQLKTGDQVLTRLVAIDRKGNRGESVPLRIVVAASDYDPDRHAAMESKIAVCDLLDELASQFEQHRQSAHGLIEQVIAKQSTGADMDAERLALLDLSIKQTEQLNALVGKIHDVQADMEAGADSQDLELVGRVLVKMQRDYAATPAYLLERMSRLPQQASADDANSLKHVFDRTADDAKQTAEHFRYLAAFNLVRALAVDLAAMLKQQTWVVQSPTQTWERLLRQESVVLQQLESLEVLIESHIHHLPESLVRPANDLVFWSGTQSSRLRDAMESEDQLEQLQGVSRSLLHEIQSRQRAESMDGSLPGRLNIARKDLEHRAGTLYTVLDELGRAMWQGRRLLDQAAQAPDTQTSQSLTQQAELFQFDVNRLQHSGLLKLSDFRTLTQNRPDADSQFAADLGLTSRAVFALLFPDSTGNLDDAETAKHLLEIAPAYRTLEAGHDFEIALRNAIRLMEQERWNHEGLDAHIDHPRQWDLVEQTLETASARLRQANVPDEITRAIDEVRWSQSTRDAGRRIQERRWNRDLMVGAGHELTELRDKLIHAKELLEPVMAQARATISQFAPTLPEMARQTAARLRELEADTTAKADELEQQSDPASPGQLNSLEQQQTQINQQLSDLFEALVEDANNQDLEDQAQRERARDADAAIATIEPPAVAMNQVLQQALDAREPKQQVPLLALAAENQERTAQALERVAEHYERLDHGDDPSDTRQALRDSLPANSAFDEQSPQFEEARRLAQLLEQDAQDLMEQLEVELQQNPAMQQALSEIARHTLDDAEDALDFAARDEQNLQRNNEHADPEFQQRKQELVSEMRELAQQASELSNALVARAQQSAAIGRTNDAADSLQEARDELQNAAAKAYSVNDNLTLRELDQAIDETQRELRQATENLRKAEGQTDQGQKDSFHENDASRQSARQQAERRHRDFTDQQKRSADNTIRQRSNEQRQAQQQVAQAEQRVADAQRQLKEAQKNAEAHPENQGLQRAINQRQSHLDSQEAVLQRNQERLAQAEQNVERAKSAREEIDQQAAPELNAPNPDTQLADHYAQEAIKLAEEMNRKADELAAATDFQQTLTPPRDRIAASRDEQQEVGRDVRQVAEDLARAARHERRLSNEPAADAVDNASQEVRQLADNQVTNAERRLQESVQQADDAENTNVTPQTVTAAQQALAESQDALSDQADKLAAATQAMTSGADESAESPDSAPTNSSSTEQDSTAGAASANDPGSDQSARQPSSSESGLSAQEMQRGRQLAQALDELDRLRAAGTQNSADAQAEAENSDSGQLPLQSLQQALQQSRAAMSATRMSRQQQSRQMLNQASGRSQGTPPSTGPQGDVELQAVNRREERDWGKLRSQSADDLSRGSQDSVSSEYRESVEAYFKVLAERAGKNK